MHKPRKLLTTIRNQLISSLFVGVLSGFIFAIYLGAFSSKDYENVTDWLAVLVASVAAGISLYAVRLVARTLKATQDTLAATVQMANDQRRIGNAQIRPWVLASSYSINERDYDDYTAVIHFKNFGHTPARFVRIWSRLSYEAVVEGRRESGEQSNDDKRHYIAPSEEVIVRQDINMALTAPYSCGLLLFKIEYFDIIGKENENASPWNYEVGFKVVHDADGPVISIN